MPLNHDQYGDDSWSVIKILTLLFLALFYHAQSVLVDAPETVCMKVLHALLLNANTLKHFKCSSC